MAHRPGGLRRPSRGRPRDAVAVRSARARRSLAAYEEVAPLADGHADRVALWQLMPLLVHAALFGGGYGASAVAAMRRYVG